MTCMYNLKFEGVGKICLSATQSFLPFLTTGLLPDVKIVSFYYSCPAQMEFYEIGAKNIIHPMRGRVVGAVVHNIEFSHF